MHTSPDTIESDCAFNLKGHDLLLCSDKAIYWPEMKILLLADMHIGKATHFQKNGLNVPNTILGRDISRIGKLTEKYEIERVIVLGDLFHSRENSEWDVFGEWLLTKSFQFDLVKGNHDILPFDCYEKFNINTYDQLNIGSFILTHKPPTEFNSNNYFLCGHIHPAIELRGKGYQNIKVECFYFGKYYAILPSFGSFTGNEILKPGKEDKIFAITGNSVVEV